MPKTPEPTLTGYYGTARIALWTVCRDCRTWQSHTLPGLHPGAHIDICGRPACQPDCPLRTSWYRIRVSAYAYLEARKLWGDDFTS